MAAMTPEVLQRAARDFLHETIGGDGTLHRMQGRSMRPFFHEGMIAHVVPIDENLSIGDVVVYRRAGNMIAHRIIADCANGSFRICGDAEPTIVHTVARTGIVGRVDRVWGSANFSDSEISQRRLRFAARLMLGTRTIRGLSTKVLELYRAVVAHDPVGTRPFCVLVNSTLAFSCGDDKRGVALLREIPQDRLIPAIGRHGMAGLLDDWLVRSEAAQREPLESSLRDLLRRARLVSTLQRDSVLGGVRAVVALLNADDIPYVILKGAARLASGVPWASLHLASDIDILVPEQRLYDAEAALLRSGYRTRSTTAIRSDFYRRFAHHGEPLHPPETGVPVELHRTLIRRSLVSNTLDFDALRECIVEVEGPAGNVCMFDSVGQAIHLAYHADQLRPWRDIVVLARLLRDFTPVERTRFKTIIHRESKNRIRVRAAVHAADLLNGEAKTDNATRRYLRWVMVREALPIVLRHRAGALEGIFSRTGVERFGFPYYRHAPYLAQASLRWMLNLAAIPLIGYWYMRNRRSLNEFLTHPKDSHS